MIAATFIMEQHLGHGSYSKNLRSHIERRRDVRASWVEVTYEGEGPLIARLPWVPDGLKGPLRGRFQARRGLANNPSDVALFNTQVPALLAGRTVGRQPYVLCTDITPLQYNGLAQQYDHRPDRNGIEARAKHFLNARLFKGASQIVPWSNWVRGSLISDYGVDPSLITVIAPGIDLDTWKPAERGGDGTPLRILFVGGDWERKGGPELVEAFRNLAPGTSELHLVTREPLEMTDERVVVHNDMSANSDELISLYQSCDIFALPSRAEAFGIAAAEACAIGMPVIGSRSGGLEDIVDDGQTGHLVDVGDVAALTRHLRELIENSETRLEFGRAARKKAEREFDAANNADHLMGILSEAVREHGTS